MSGLVTSAAQPNMSVDTVVTIILGSACVLVHRRACTRYVIICQSVDSCHRIAAQCCAIVCSETFLVSIIAHNRACMCSALI